ncbi:MAG: sterol desaturase family protein, partial [Methylococcales bacterium]|nr:sterol desaturase family protein [Methylococcales bacterium]
MTEWVLSYEATIRLTCFFGIFAVMFLREVLAPKRPLSVSKALRWRSNIGIVVLNTVVLRLLFPTAAVGVALVVEQQGWGVLNVIQNHVISEPNLFYSSLIVITAVIVMDLAIYTQHVMSHQLPMLWRLHRVHHTDLDYDVTTGARFHPLEIIFSMLIKMAVITALGSPAVAVVIFEVILSSAAMFNHG